MDDVRLLERIGRGDEAAFAELYAAHHPPIFRYALQMCGASEADDVVQDTFMALLRQPGGYEPVRGPLLNYLFGIARHHVLRRVASLRFEVSIDDEDGEIGDAFSKPGLTPFDDLSRVEDIAAVRMAIQSLPPVYREVIALCELQEMDYAVAAALIGCPVGTVRSRLHRSRALLASKLAVRQPAASGRG